MESYDKETGSCVLKRADVPRAALTRSCILADVEAEDSGDITLPISYSSFQQWIEYHADADAGVEQSLQMLQVRCLPLSVLERKQLPTHNHREFNADCMLSSR